MSKLNPKVDQFISKAKHWQEEFIVLREIVLSFPFSEEFKWWQPVYTLQGNNVLIMSGFKDYCVVGFFKGVLINDVHNLLHAPGPNTQSARMMRFCSVQEINEKESLIREYIRNAIDNEKAGLKVVFKKSNEFVIPEELAQKFTEMPALKHAFEALTPGRQRAYVIHFSQPKQAKTRVGRIEKYTEKILSGKGFQD